MKRLILIFLMIAFFDSAAGGEQGPAAISYTLQEVTVSGAVITLKLNLEVTNTGPGAIGLVSLRLLPPAGDDQTIQGEAAFGSIAAGETGSAVGTFTAPKEYYEGASFSGMAWILTFQNAQGQTQRHILSGSKR